MTETSEEMTHSRAEGQQEPPHGVPLWVKVFIAGAIILVVVLLAMHGTGHSIGGHG